MCCCAKEWGTELESWCWCECETWVFHVTLVVHYFMNGCTIEMKVRDLGTSLKMKGMEQPLMAGLFAGSLLSAENVGMLHRVEDDFGNVCKGEC